MKEQVYNSIFKSWIPPFTTYFGKPKILGEGTMGSQIAVKNSKKMFKYIGLKPRTQEFQRLK